MAMSWNFTLEKLKIARHNLSTIPHGTLWEIWCEIQTFLEVCEREGVNPATLVCRGHFWDEVVYSGFLSRPIWEDREDLEKSIWEYAESLKECDNDFSIIFLCPYGCHAVKLD